MEQPKPLTHQDLKNAYDILTKHQKPTLYCPICNQPVYSHTDKTSPCLECRMEEFDMTL
jgi:Zn finger protein HypA/HybF involved in hydrogenase expression